MKVYICASLEDEKEAIEIANFLKARGHTITREWWNYKNKNLKDEYAFQDLIAIKECDFFVIFDSETKTSGKYIELGIAIGLGKPIINLGKKLTSVFKIFTSYSSSKNYSNIVLVGGVHTKREPRDTTTLECLKLETDSVIGKRGNKNVS